MTIAVKSETDSRVVVYPLMWALKSFGTILVVTSNRQFRRLVDDEEFSTFRDIMIIVDEEGGTDDVFSSYGVAENDYDFVILDNVGSVEFDNCLVVLGNKQSEAFQSDIEYIQNSEDSNKYVFIDFGNGAVAKEQAKAEAKTKAESKTAENKKAAAKKSSPVSEEDYDPTEKFKAMVPGSEIKKEKVKPFKCKFPTFADIELVEGDHRFYQVGLDLVKVFHSFLGTPLAVSMDKFSKVVRSRDESSNNRKK